MSIRVGLLGFGGMGKVHYNSYLQLEREGVDVKVAAVCDVNPEQFKKAQQINIDTGKSKYNLDGRNLYTDFAEMIEKEELDMVDICLPTYLHAQYTVAMLNAGKHVMCEKPMALNSSDCQNMIETANKNGKRLMIGQCLRFEPLYLFLKEKVDSGEYGKVNFMTFERLSALPQWGFERWFKDDKRSGGCALDLHIHDVDMIRFLLGEPENVSAAAKDDECRWQFISSRFGYRDVPVVTAVGSWMESNALGFRMGYSVGFEKAQVVLSGSTVSVYPMTKEINDGKAFTPTLPSRNRIAEEIRFFLSAINDENADMSVNSPESAMRSVKLVEKLCYSADNGGIIV